MEKATIILENNLGVKLDIEKSPLSLTAYDFDGNVISGGGGGVNVTHITAHIVNNTNSSLGFGSVIETYSGYGCITEGYIFMSGESGTESISIPANSSYDILFAVMTGTGYIEVSSNTGTISDGVNIETDVIDDLVDINIADPDTDGSFTFTIN